MHEPSTLAGSGEKRDAAAKSGSKTSPDAPGDKPGEAHISEKEPGVTTTEKTKPS